PTALLGAQTASLLGWRTIRGLASSRAAFCGMRPHGYKSLTSCRKAMKTIAARQKGACYFCELLGLQGVLPIWAFNYPIRPPV
ncbi:MAG: hypothetical protein UH541_09335, partial [Prevotella sp.]|nr:hypothetical protein [Prevotella sp.]